MSRPLFNYLVADFVSQLMEMGNIVLLLPNLLNGPIPLNLLEHDEWILLKRPLQIVSKVGVNYSQNHS